MYPFSCYDVSWKCALNFTQSVRRQVSSRTLELTYHGPFESYYQRYIRRISVFIYCTVKNLFYLPFLCVVTICMLQMLYQPFNKYFDKFYFNLIFIYFHKQNHLKEINRIVDEFFSVKRKKNF